MNHTGTPSWMTIQDRSQEFRWLERDGKLVLQVACPFQHQYAGGFEWRDIPIVREEKTSQAVSLQPSTFTIMFTMKFKIVKTDRRHTANHIFNYYVEPAYELGVGRDERIELFKELRAWCWEQFGPGAERDFVVLRPVPAGTDGQCKMAARERWCWLTTTDLNSELRIYFNEAELAWFKLKWIN